MNKIKPVALFDIDNTIYDGFSYFALLETQVGEGLIKRRVLARALESMRRYKDRQQDYEYTIVELLDVYAAGLKGRAYSDVLLSTAAFYKKSDKFFSFVKPVFSALAHTHDISLVTGEPQFVAEAVGTLFGIKSYAASTYEVDGNGICTGEVTRHLASRYEKHAATGQLMRGHDVKGSFAFGDSEGDIEMLRAVEFAICLNATEGLRRVAEQEGWYMPDVDQVPGLVNALLGEH